MNLTKNNFLSNLRKLIFLLMIASFTSISGEIAIQAEENYQLNDLEMNNTTKSDGENSLDLPSNPFEVMDIIRRSTMMDNATNPSDAIDEALKAFDMLENSEGL